MDRVSSSRKKKYKFNVIDFLIILAVAAVVGGMALRYGYYRSERENMDRDEATITILASGVSEEMRDAISEGDRISFVNGGEFTSTLETASSEGASVAFTGNKGEVTLSGSGDTYDVTLVIKTTGTLSSTGYRVGGKTDVAIGKTLAVYSPGFVVQGKVINIETNAARN